ncbi:unknown [Bacteroides sp. CAG:702]|nr:unknown [Bacteroides sp. CAG:702]
MWNEGFGFIEFCNITCRGRVCLPENIYMDAYGWANPAPTWNVCG